MMKKLFYITFFFFIGIISAWGNETTTEHVTFSQVALQPGGDGQLVSVHLATASDYTAVTLDIYLPEGLAFAPKVKKEKETFCEKGEACFDDHSVSAAVQADGALRVVVMSTSSETFWDDETEVFKFYVKALPFAKPGPVTLQVKNCFYNTAAAVQVDTDDTSISNKVSVATSATAILAITSENKWSTLVVPFDATLPDGVKAYTCSSKDASESVLILTPAASLMAFTPYILYSENGYEGKLSGEVSAGNYPAGGVVSAGLLKGAITQQVAGAGEYVLANKGVTQFYRVENTKTIPAGKCWVTLPSGMSAKENLSFQIATGIDMVTKEKTAGAIYTIAGKKISTPLQHQIYVEGGKKKIRR